MKHTLHILFISLIALLIGCSSQENKSDSDQLTVYTTIYPIQYISEFIAGDHIQIKSVYPPGVDAHTYEPTSKEMTDIAKADALIYLGANMESFIDTIRSALASQDILFVEIGEHQELFLTLEDEDHDHHHDEHDHGDVDPHIWLDPLRMITMGEIILETLINLDPAHEETFRAQFEQFEKNMITLDETFVETLKQKTQKDILVAHAAYGYWENRYGIKQIPIKGLTIESEPSQQALTEIVDIATEKNIEYVIFEQAGSDRVVKIIQEHLGAEALYIHNLEVLTDTDIEKQEDYLSLMKHNLSVLDQATK